MLDFRIAIIDGTGSWSSKTYAEEMENSFCSQLGVGLAPNSNYERGPTFEGYRIKERSVRAVNYLKQSGASKLMLAGYSRGGSAAVIAAVMLQKLGLSVDFLFLFDPVDRHLSGDTNVIPGNVKEAWIARRIIGAQEMNKYDHTPGMRGGHNPVRNWFGTTATGAEEGVTIVNNEFLGSHGALGGVGWAVVKEDPHCQTQVATFMNRGLASAGVEYKLYSKTPHLIVSK